MRYTEPEYCPRCQARVRTLRLADGPIRHNQCTGCGYRYENVPEAYDENGDFDCLAGLDALPEDEQEAMESLVWLIVGNSVMVGGANVTSRTIADLVAEHGAPQSVMRGFAWPAHKWLERDRKRYMQYIVAIDQGQWRVCFTIRRLNPVPLKT